MRDGLEVFAGGLGWIVTQLLDPEPFGRSFLADFLDLDLLAGSGIGHRPDLLSSLIRFRTTSSSPR